MTYTINSSTEKGLSVWVFTHLSEIAWTFDNYLLLLLLTVDIGSALSEGKSHNTGSVSKFLNGSYLYLQSFDPPTEEEIKDIISNLKDPAACHHKVMSSLFIKFGSLIIKPFTHTFSKISWICNNTQWPENC